MLAVVGTRAGLAGLVTAALAFAAPAAAAGAGWTSPQAVQPGVRPVLAFSPTGAAVLGSALTRHGRPSGAEIDRTDANASFAATPQRLAAPSAGHGPEPLAGLALSSHGELAASFADPTRPSPVLTRVGAPGATGFAPTQTLIHLGAGASGQATPDSLALLSTTAGEIVGAGSDDAGRLSTATLAGTPTRLRTRPGPTGLSASDDYALATDPAGGTYLAGDGADGCSTVAFRPAHGTFTTTYRTGNCSSDTPNVFDAIAATGSGRAGVLSEDVSEAGTQASRLFIQVGVHGHLGAARQLGGALGGPVGLAADADGELTAEWTGCLSGPLIHGRLSLEHCSIDAATGSAASGFSAAAARGTTLMVATRGVTLSAATADRAVLVSRCTAPGRCGLDAFTARPGGGFRAAVSLARVGRLIALSGDAHGDLLAVWLDAQGRLFAATGTAASGRWSRDHRLSAEPVSAADVSAAYGPRGAAIVAWSRGAETYAASYSSISGA